MKMCIKPNPIQVCWLEYKWILNKYAMLLKCLVCEIKLCHFLTSTFELYFIALSTVNKGKKITSAGLYPFLYINNADKNVGYPLIYANGSVLQF